MVTFIRSKLDLPLYRRTKNLAIKLKVKLKGNPAVTVKGSRSPKTSPPYPLWYITIRQLQLLPKIQEVLQAMERQVELGVLVRRTGKGMVVEEDHKTFHTRSLGLEERMYEL
jgi:hypothetical protein